MDERMTRAPLGSEENHMLPFLWMIDDEATWQWEKPYARDWNRERTLALMQRIRDCGITAYCLESRTFEDFCGEKWWRALRAVLEEARRLEMRVWILDDTHFPTGYAAGLLGRKYADRRRLFLAERHMDVMGPRSVDMILEPFEPDDGFVAALAVRRDKRDESLSANVIRLHPDASRRYVSFDAPEGCWRVFFLWQTHRGSLSGDAAYVNCIDPESVDAQIEGVYEAHYKHVGEYFGRELAGFFSDEPCLGNAMVADRPSGDLYDQKPGQPGLAMPWRRDLKALLDERLGHDCLNELPLLWYEGDNAAQLRVQYMDLVSQLYGMCFSQRLGDWCRAHGVAYIGHIIEDMNANARLGCSCGHFFRAMQGQDMAGIDVVLHQVLPGFAHYDSACSANELTGSAFFHYVLGKLGSSLAHIRPQMQGRTVCEVFGAYGWAADVPLMKWLIDFMLVRGVNYFVPHAFSPVYPNPDSPPHFFAGGENPQFDDFAVLMRYTNRMCNLLTGNRVVRVAILYHAEAEWSGRACMLDEVPAQALLDSQIDFDIVPADDLRTPVMRDGHWIVGNASYEVLIVPWAAMLPEFVCEGIRSLQSAGVQVVEVDRHTDGLDAQVVKLDDLPTALAAMGVAGIRLRDDCPLLRVMHIQRDNADGYLFFNEDTAHPADTEAWLPSSGAYRKIDLLGGMDERMFTNDGQVCLSLQPYESVIYVFDGADAPLDAPKVYHEEVIQAVWRIEAARAENLEDFRLLAEETPLTTVEGFDREFVGRVRYTARLADTRGDVAALSLSGVGDTALVRVNGVEVGRRVCPPYRFDVGNAWHKGENSVEITVSTTLARKFRDQYSRYLAMNRPGLAGPVSLLRG